jgi:predicted transposase YbfD/YdcC
MPQNPFRKRRLMIAQPRPLIEVLAEIPDFRKTRGKRHALASILALACCAVLCGYRSYSAMAEWGRNYGWRLVHALGFRHKPPCAATFYSVFRHLDCETFEAKIGRWAQEMVAHSATPHEGQETALGLDGKTLRGSKKHGAPGVHLLSAVAHDLGLTLAQQSVADKTNEITAVATLLAQVVLEGRMVTMDALWTQKHIAQTIVDAGGDYVMVVKDNQPHLRADIELVFAMPPWGDVQQTATTWDIGHGRIERRTITTSEALESFSEWPGLRQVFHLERQVHFPKSGQDRLEVVYGVTSLSSARATPSRLLELVRGHWHIENKSHWVRDVTFDEDRSQVRCGHIPQVMAALRNIAIGLLRWQGYTNIAAACRQVAAQPARALALIGIELEN